MGLSGSGKATLLNVFARRAAFNKAKVSGSLLVDNYKSSKAEFRAHASFVEQGDALIEYWIVDGLGNA